MLSRKELYHHVFNVKKKSSSLQSHNGLFWAFWHKKYCKTSGAKLRSAIELSSLKWSDDSDSVSPLGEFILVGCQLIQQFPVSFSRKPLSNMNFMLLWKKGEKETWKNKKARGRWWLRQWV